MLRRNGDLESAIRTYRALLALDLPPETVRRILRRLGETLLQNGEPQEAEVVLLRYLDQAPLDATAWFWLGRVRESLRDWAGAVAAYRTYRGLDDTLADHAGIRIAAALQELQRFDEAAEEYRTVNAITPDPKLAARALEGLAELALAREDAGEAARWYARAAARTDDVGERARLLGLAGASHLAAGQRDAAVRTFRRLITEHPETKMAYTALAELRVLGEAVDLRLQGLVYYHNGDARAAVQAFTAYVTGNTSPLGDAYYFLGRSYERLGRWSAAIGAYERLIEAYPGHPWFGAAWVRKARALRRLGRLDDAVNTYREFARRYPADALADNALWEAARALEGAGRKGEAVQLYGEILARYPRGDFGREAAFRVGIVPYLQERYAEALQAWQKAATRVRTPEARARVLLWAAKAALALGDRRTAQANLDAAARTAPLHFDGLRAQALGGHLPSLPEPSPTTVQQWLGLDTATWNAIEQRLRQDQHYRRGMALLAVGLRDEGLAALKALRNAYWNLPAHLARLAMLLDNPVTRHLSISAAERVLVLTGTSPLEAPRELARLAYPADYADLVRAEAGRNGLDPRLLLALIRQESRFNLTARSYADARGLTQVIPSTARLIAQRLGIRDFTLDSLYRPYRSIQFGAWYLGEQLRRFEGDVLAALAAYNAGPGNARRWRRLTDDPDMFVASIHLDQTQDFVRWVMEQYAVYRQLYDEELAPRTKVGDTRLPTEVDVFSLLVIISSANHPIAKGLLAETTLADSRRPVAASPQRSAADWTGGAVTGKPA